MFSMFKSVLKTMSVKPMPVCVNRNREAGDPWSSWIPQHRLNLLTLYTGLQRSTSGGGDDDNDYV